jgi:flagellar motor switch protein FliN/FliY
MSTPASVAAASLQALQAEEAGGKGTQVSMDDILDLPVLLSLEVGRKQIGIRELLQLTAGSVIELNRDTGDAFDVYVNGSLLAHGEAVVVNEKCGVRMTDVIRPAERNRQSNK